MPDSHHDQGLIISDPGNPVSTLPDCALRSIHPVDRNKRLEATHEDFRDRSAGMSRRGADAGHIASAKEGAGRGRKGLPDRQANLFHRMQRGELLHPDGVRSRQMEKDTDRLRRISVSAEMLTARRSM